MVAAMNSQPATTLTGERFFNLLGGYGKDANESAVKNKANTGKQQATGETRQATTRKVRDRRRKMEEERRKTRNQEPET
jgi:hypothetical protein